MSCQIPLLYQGDISELTNQCNHLHNDKRQILFHRKVAGVHFIQEHLIQQSDLYPLGMHVELVSLIFLE